MNKVQINKQTTTKIIRVLAVVLATAGAFLASASDITHGAIVNGQTGMIFGFQVATLYPVVIDCAFLGCALTVVVRTGLNWRARAWAQVGRFAAGGFTLLANGLSANTAAFMPIVIRCIPAIMVIILVETIVHSAQSASAGRRSAGSKPAGKITQKLYAVGGKRQATG